MKVDKVVAKETCYTALGVIVCSVIMQIVFLILGKYDYTVLLGSIYGAVIVTLNFFFLGITVQHAVDIEDPDEAKKKIQISYHARRFLIFVLAAAGAILPCFNFIAVLVTLIFPRIYMLFAPAFRKDLKEEKQYLQENEIKKKEGNNA